MSAPVLKSFYSVIDFAVIIAGFRGIEYERLALFLALRISCFLSLRTQTSTVEELYSVIDFAVLIAGSRGIEH